MKGWVYVATMQDAEGVVKIGYSFKDPVQRVKQWSEITGAPGKAKLIYSGLFENPRKIESATHRHFKEFRTRGEWFRVSAQEAIKTIQNISTPLYEEHAQGQIANDRATRLDAQRKVKSREVNKGCFELIFRLVFVGIGITFFFFLIGNVVNVLPG